VASSVEAEQKEQSMPDCRQRPVASRRVFVGALLGVNQPWLGGRRATHTALWLAAGLILVALSISCGSSSPSSPSPQASPSPQVLAQALPLSQDSANFTFHYSAGDSVDPPHEEAWYAWAIIHLGVKSPQKIEYYKYTSTFQMQQITGMAANGWADPPNFSIHAIFPWNGHEIVHVLTAVVGRPSDFFNEGIAVSMQVDPYASDPTQALWNGAPLDTIARAALAGGRLPHVPNMADTSSFRVIPDTDGYPWAGSFLQFLVTNYGMTRTLDFFRAGGGRDESLSTIMSRFEQVYGISLTDADLAWRGYLSH
jgi:hypothetical protein